MSLRGCGGNGSLCHGVHFGGVSAASLSQACRRRRRVSGTGTWSPPEAPCREARTRAVYNNESVASEKKSTSLRTGPLGRVGIRRHIRVPGPSHGVGGALAWWFPGLVANFRRRANDPTELASRALARCLGNVAGTSARRNSWTVSTRRHLGGAGRAVTRVPSREFSWLFRLRLS
jgi:hypothetical protein